MAYYYELGNVHTNPYLLLMASKSARTYDELIADLQTAGKITYQDEYVIQIGESMFSIDSIRALFSCKRLNIPIYYV